MKVEPSDLGRALKEELGALIPPAAARMMDVMKLQGMLCPQPLLGQFELNGTREGEWQP